MKTVKTLLVILLLASTTACGSAETNESSIASSSSTQNTQLSGDQNALRKTNNTLSEILLGKDRTVWYQVSKSDKSQKIFSIYVFENGKLWRIGTSSGQWERSGEEPITIGDITKMTDQKVISKFTEIAAKSFDFEKEHLIDHNKSLLKNELILRESPDASNYPDETETYKGAIKRLEAQSYQKNDFRNIDFHIETDPTGNRTIRETIRYSYSGIIDTTGVSTLSYTANGEEIPTYSISMSTENYFQIYDKYFIGFSNIDSDYHFVTLITSKMVEEGYQIVFDQPGAEHVTVD